MVKTAEMVGRRPGVKASGFSVTCSLLGQYLKEKGSLGDLPVGLSATPHLTEPTGKPEALRTMNLLPGVEAAGGDADCPAAPGVEVPALSMRLSPLLSDEKKPDLIRKAQRGQMTIFYGGKVMVFDNFPADKASELMSMAGRGCPAPAHNSKTEQLAPLPPQRPSCPPPVQQNSPASAANSDAKSAAATAGPTPAVAAQEAPQKPAQPAASDLPIARRVSLHRFLEKRKDRISAKAPYPVSGYPASLSPAKAEEEKRQWLGLAPHASPPEDLLV